MHRNVQNLFARNGKINRTACTIQFHVICRGLNTLFTLIQLQCQHASGADNCMRETGTHKERARRGVSLFNEYAIVNQTHNGLRLPKAAVEIVRVPVCRRRADLFLFLWACCRNFDNDPRTRSQSRITITSCHLGLTLLANLFNFQADVS